MLHGLGLAGCLFAGVSVPQPTLERARGDRTQNSRTQNSRTGNGRRRADRRRSGWVQQPPTGPAPIIAGDRPPPLHPERLVPDQPWTEAEREIWNELRDVLVWPL